MTGQLERKTDRHEDDVAARDIIDFKMVTFSLGGKDYGIDIMKIKEIAKFYQFTYVPNTAPYVRGVYNLRGDIISIIDLRRMFNLPAEEKPEGQPENGLILRLDQTQIGVIVDSIDKVVGFSSHQIQPPHPIFGDINIKFISGVVEYQERLYIILDVDRIFRKADESEKKPQVTTQLKKTAVQKAVSAPEAEEQIPEARSATPTSPVETVTGANRSFLQEGIATFSSFHVTRVNDQWFTGRVAEWENARQITSHGDSEEFLRPFWSQCTGVFWDKPLINAVSTHLPDRDSSLVHLWNPGCGGGHESYSLAVLLRDRYPDHQIKVWAGDTDLLKISTAPNLVFQRSEIPQEWTDYVTEGKQGLSFVSALKDTILFEFSDVLNGNALPRMDVIVARDLVSLLPPVSQEKFFAVMEEVLKPSGLLMLGENEQPLDMGSWELVDDTISMYRLK
jgi:chemotaxis signal transduction protein/chemotaxis methyl-accepting protein methylase